MYIIYIINKLYIHDNIYSISETQKKKKINGIPVHWKVVGNAVDPVAPPQTGVVLPAGMKPGAHCTSAALPIVPDGQLAGLCEALALAVFEE